MKGSMARAWSAVGAIAVLTSLWFFYPRISIEPTEPLNPSNPFTVPFRVANQGNLPIYPLVTSCAIHAVRTSSMNMTNGVMIPTERIIGRLGSGDADVATCPIQGNRGSALSGGGALISADISVSVSFRQLVWPFRVDVSRRFATAPEVGGELRWIQRSSG